MKYMPILTGCLLKDEAGSWSAFVNLGPSVNTAQAEADAFFSPHRQSLFFTRDGAIYQVSAQILEDLRPKRTDGKKEDTPSIGQGGYH